MATSLVSLTEHELMKPLGGWSQLFVYVCVRAGAYGPI